MIFFGVGRVIILTGLQDGLEMSPRAGRPCHFDGNGQPSCIFRVHFFLRLTVLGLLARRVFFFGAVGARGAVSCS